MKRNIIVSVITVILFIAGCAQKKDVLSLDNVKEGPIYCLVFKYDKKLQWIPLDGNQSDESIKSDDIKSKEGKAKFIEYQKKLKQLGYNLEITGILDKKTRKAHDDYITFLEKNKNKLDLPNNR